VTSDVHTGAFKASAGYGDVQLVVELDETRCLPHRLRSETAAFAGNASPGSRARCFSWSPGRQRYRHAHAPQGPNRL